MSLQNELPSKGSSDFRMSTKVYYQSLNNATLPPADGTDGNKDWSSHPVQVLHSATDRSLVPLGEFDAFPVAEKASPTQLFSFTSRKGTDLFKEHPNDAGQVKAGKDKGGRKVSFTSGDLIDSEDVLRLECLQGGAFKMFIPSSPELNRPPLCFEIKPPANVILDLPKCNKKPNIKVVVTTICSTGNPNEQSHQKSEGGIDVTTSNLDDPEIEELIRELCQVIVETHKNEARNSQRKQLKEPPQVVELYKRKKVQEEESANCEYAVLSNTEAICDSAFTYHHEDEGYFYFQPQSDPKGSSVRLFVDKMCGCLGKAFGLISRDEVDRRPAPMKMEVDNDPQEGYVRCLLMGKTPKNDGEDCACDQQPVAEIRNSSELMDKQSPLVDRIMYLLRKGVSHEFSNEALFEGSGEGDFDSPGYKGDGGSAGGTAKHKGDHKEGVHAEDKASKRKSKADKHHTRFRTGSGNEMTDSVGDGAEGPEDAKGKKKHKDKKEEKLRRNLCCSQGMEHQHKPYMATGSKQSPNDNKGDSDEVVHKDAVKEKVAKHKKKSEKIEVKGSDEVKPSESAGLIKPPNIQKGGSMEMVHKDAVKDKVGKHKKKPEKMEAKGSDEVKPSESAGLIRPPATRGSSSSEEVYKTRNDRKKSKQEKQPEELDEDYDMNAEAILVKPSESSRLLKRSYLRRGSGKDESEKPTKESKKDKKKKSDKGSDDESDSSKNKAKKTKSKESKKNPIEFERRKMIGTRDREYWASYRRLRRRQMEKQDTEYRESVISANLSVDGHQMSSESSSDSDTYLVEIAYDDPMHKSEKNDTSDRYFRWSRRSQPHRSHLHQDSSDLSQKPSRTKNNAEEMRDGSAMADKRSSSCKSKPRSKSSKLTALESSCNERSSKVHGEPHREAAEESKSMRRSKSSSKFLREIEAKLQHKKSFKGIFGRKKKEDKETKMNISGSHNKQDDETDPRNISEVMEAQTLKDKFDKEQRESKDDPANEMESATYSSLNDDNKNDDSGINLVIPCGTCPSEEADYIGLSSWENPITKSKTAIDSKCESLCVSCKNSITPSQTKDQTRETTSTTSIASRKSILVGRGLPDNINCCRTSVYSMSEGTTSGFTAVPLLPASASLDSKLRQQEQLERLNPLDSPTDSATLQPGTDSSDQTLDTSASEITNNSSEVETKSTTFDSGTSVVSNATIDSALAQNAINESTESKDTTTQSNISHKKRELSSTTMDTWSSISSASDILRNQSSISSNQDTSSANDSTNGLSSDGSQSLINSVIEPLRSDLQCDDGSQSMYGESSGDSRSTTALSATSTIDSGLSIGTQATSESIQTQDSAISKDITNSSGESFESRDSNQNDSRSQSSCITSETERKASNTVMLKRDASQHVIFSEISKPCSSRSAISLELPNITVANSTTSLSLRHVKGTSQHNMIAPATEDPAVIKIKSTDAVATVASRADELIAAPSRVSSTASINSAKQICYQVPDMGPTFTDAMISSAAPGAESNRSEIRSNSDQESDDRPVVGNEGVLGDEETRGQGEIGILNNENEPIITCPVLPVVPEDNLVRDTHEVKISEGNPPAETLEELPKEKVPNEMTIVETLVENTNDSNETENQPSKKKISRRRHNVMATFMCIGKPCRSGRHSDSFSPYMPAQPGLDVSRNLSDTIPQTDHRLKEQPHNKRRLFPYHSKDKKTKENGDKENTNKPNKEEIKLKSILSKTLHKENRCKLTKKVSFSPTNSFIEAPVTPGSSTSKSQSETEAEMPMSNFRPFNIRSSSSDSILPTTPSAGYLHNESTAPTARTPLIRARGSFSGEIHRELRQRDERRLEVTSNDDSYSCSSRDDDDDTTFEINSRKTREPPRVVRLQLSNLMCESIPSRASVDNLQRVENFQDDADTCALMMDEESDAGSERSIQENNEQDREENEKSERENYCKEKRFSENDEKRKLVSTPKTKNRKIDFLKDCPIENEDAELEKQNSARKLVKKRQLFVQKVSSLIKVTPIENNDEKMTIADRDPIESGKKTAKKPERVLARKNTSKDDDSSSTQKHSRGPRTEDDRHKKA